MGRDRGRRETERRETERLTDDGCMIGELERCAYIPTGRQPEGRNNCGYVMLFRVMFSCIIPKIRLDVMLDTASDYIVIATQN